MSDTNDIDALLAYMETVPRPDLRANLAALVLEREALIKQRDEAQANLARVVAQRDGYLEGNRQTLRALAEANEIAARYKQQRVEALDLYNDLRNRLTGRKEGGGA